MKYRQFVNSEKEIKEKLQSEIGIPENVQKRMNQTLEEVTGIPVINDGKILQEQEARNILENRSLNQRSFQKRDKVIFFGAKKLRLAAACLAFVLVAVGGTAGAYSIWNHFEEKRYGITEENKDYLKQEKILNEETTKVTKNGVKVECVETVAAGPYAHVLLKVTVPEGVSVDENTSFDKIEAMENNKYDLNYCGGMSIDEETFNEMVDSKNGTFYYDFIFNTLEAQYDKKEVVETNKNINWDGQMLNLRLRNLVKLDKAAVDKVLVKGSWNLDIPMKASDEVKSIQPETTLSCGATVEEVTLSPISIKVTYNYPRQAIKERAYDGEMGKETDEYVIDYKSPDMATRYELKDGTIKDLELGMGSEGYVDEKSDQFVSDFSVEKILNLDEIAAIYFGEEKIVLQ